MTNPRDIAEELRKWTVVCGRAHLPVSMIEFMEQVADTVDDLADQVDTLQKDLHECQAKLDKFEEHQMWEDAADEV